MKFAPGTSQGVMNRVNRMAAKPIDKTGSAMGGPRGGMGGPGMAAPVRTAPAYNTANILTRKKGGPVKESKEMAKKEVSFMKKAGAPKSMIKHEKAEAGMKSGGKVKKFDGGGMAYPRQNPRPGVAPFKGGITKKMAGGGLTAGHKAADGVASKGKTKGKMVKMAGGGMRGGKC